ncbi:MAG TPA: methyltransferase [Acidimicrobiales bacterium]|nr:methyltransferase [Acidimicrobiales bacterium]
MLREVLVAADYTRTGVRAVLPAARSGLQAQDLPLYDRQLPTGGRLPTLVRLFLLGLPVAEEEARRALAPVGLGKLHDGFLLDVRDGTATSLTHLLCVGDLLLFGDRDDAMLGQPGWVTASSPTAQLLDRLTIRRRVPSALDLGCGSGMHALLAARHSDRVTALDVNERAIAFTRLNARLNEVGNVECRQGNWFEPVADERFELIVSNPPFVVSPDADLIFRDSPLPADELSRTVLLEAAQHLPDGGFAHVLCNWVLRPGERWDDAPRRWLADAGCDAVVLHLGTDDPLSYAATWNSPLRTSDPAAFPVALDRWLEYYRRLGVTALCAGAVVVRRRAAANNWVRALRLEARPEDAAGDDLLGIFLGQDLLTARTERGALLDAPLRLTDVHEVHQVLSHGGGVYQSQRCRIVTTSGLRLGADVDPEVLQVLLRLDGSRPVREVAHRVASDLGLDEAGLVAKIASGAPELVADGLLVAGAEAGRSR